MMNDLNDNDNLNNNDDFEKTMHDLFKILFCFRLLKLGQSVMRNILIKGGEDDELD